MHNFDEFFKELSAVKFPLTFKSIFFLEVSHEPGKNM
jgi:hypothetical protein